MRYSSKWSCAIIFFLLMTSMVSAKGKASQLETGADEINSDVHKWERYEVAYENASWSGNPFDLTFKGVFRHVPTGRTMTQLGFYAGNDTWKIYFMPDAVGEWEFETVSTDPDLDGHTGSFNCVESELPGQLVGNGNRWQLQDSKEYVAPIMLPTRQWFKATETADGIDEFIAWADDAAGALIIGTTLVYFQHEQAAIPFVKGQEGEWFNIPMWDRLNSHLDMMRDRGMGFYVMFYSDDAEAPNKWGIKEQSPEEIRLFRYAVARFAAYPIVMWDTGIDIGETRSSGWIDWFADWFNANDPWQHPVGSRSGGGSGGHHPATGTFYSDGASKLPTHDKVVSDWRDCGVPRAYTDRWREDGGRGNFDRDKIRRAAWEVGLVGGTAVYVTGSENGGYLTDTYATDLQAASDLGHRSRFFREQIVNFGLLEPHNELLTAGSGAVLAANPGHEYVVYDRDGGEIGVDLSGTTNTFSAAWFNPRTGELNQIGSVSGGDVREFGTVEERDVVLHLTGISRAAPPPTIPATPSTPVTSPTPSAPSRPQDPITGTERVTSAPGTTECSDRLSGRMGWLAALGDALRLRIHAIGLTRIGLFSFTVLLLLLVVIGVARFVRK